MQISVNKNVQEMGTEWNQKRFNTIYPNQQ